MNKEQIKELIKELKKRADELASSVYNDDAKAAAILYKAADAIEELQQIAWHYEGVAKDYFNDFCYYLERISKWTPVTERLPDVFKHVLVNIPGLNPNPTVQEAFREKNGLWYSNGFRYEADEITHWMPMPEPPKED